MGYASDFSIINFKKMIWEYPKNDKAAVQTIERSLSVSRLLAKCLTTRGFKDPSKARSFLNPNLANLIVAGDIPGIAGVADFLSGFEGSVLVYGDYDVDGLTSVGEVRLLLSALQIPNHLFIPNRFEHGYGITAEGLRDALTGRSISALFALDCGTNSVPLIREYLPRKIPILIVDHHQEDSVFELEADPNTYLINPHVTGGPEYSDTLCTAGLVFKLAQRVCAVLQAKHDPRLDDIDLGRFLELASLGTVADLVNLVGENRIIVTFGIRRLARSSHHGIRALINVAGLHPEDGFDTEDLGFRIAPRLNAGGRLGEADLPLSLITDPSPQRALEVAAELDSLNRERQAIERACSQAAEPRIKSLVDANACGLIAWDDSWHHGVVGIVAGRFTHQHHRPTLILGREGDTFKGSGRAPEGLDLVQILTHCEVQPDRWGGHPAAVGLTIATDRIEAFANAFLAAAAAVCGGSPLEPRLQFSARLQAGMVDFHLLDDIDRLKPFGKGNPEPLFAIHLPGGISDLRPFGNGHLRARIPELRTVPHSLVAWSGQRNPPPERQALDLAVRIKRNRWRGREDIRLELVDWKPRSDSPSKSRSTSPR